MTEPVQQATRNAEDAEHTGNERPALLIFLCYRQVDGMRAAEWLFDLLDGESLDGNESPASSTELTIYFDRTARVVGDWRELHQPSLETARSLVFVCSPGAYAEHDG